MRFSSDFFKAYNDEIDTQRRRRSENSQAFQEYVKGQQDAGREVSVAELERMRNSLAGGDAYMAGGLPSKTALAGMSQRTKEAAAAKRAAEEQTKLANITKNMEIVQSLSKGLVGVDLNSEDGRKKVASVFEAAQATELAQKYGSLIPQYVQAHTFSSLEEMKKSIGWDTIETEDQLNATLPQVPTWAKAQLKSQWKAGYQRRISVEGQSAISQIDYTKLAASAQGDTDAAYKVAENQFISSTGRQPNAQEQARMRQALEGYVSFERTGTSNAALGKFTNNFTDEQLLAMANDPEARRALILNALASEGYTNPTPEDIARAENSVTLLSSGAKQRAITASVDKIINNLSGVSMDELATIDSPEEMDQYIESKLQSSAYSIQNYRPEDVAEAKRRIRAELTARVDAANEAEDKAANLAAYNEIHAADGLVMAAMKLPNMADRKKSVRDRIDSIRGKHGLPPISDAKFNETWERLGGVAKAAASARFEAGKLTARKTADATYDAMVASQQDEVKALLGKGSDAQIAVAQSILQKYLVPPNMRQLLVVEVARQVDQEGVDPQDPNTVIMAVNSISKRLGLTEQGQAAKDMLYRSVLADEELIEPGQDSLSFFKREINTGVMRKAEEIAAFIESLPVDDTQSAQIKVEEFQTKMRAWKEAILSEIDDDSYSYLLSDHNKSLLAAQVDQAMANAMQIVNSSERKGTFSFLNYDGQMKVFRVMTTNPDALKKAEAQGFVPNAYYRKLPDGTFEKVEMPRSDISGAQGWESMTQDQILQQYAPQYRTGQ